MVIIMKISHCKAEIKKLERDFYSLERLTHCFLSYFEDKDHLVLNKYLSDTKGDSPTHTSKSGRYHFIAHSVGCTIYQLRYARDRLKDINYPLFVDAGCGIGWVVELANYMGFKSKGIEISINNVKVANKLFNACYDSNMDVVEGDIFDHDFSKYDVIYYYCPIKDPELEIKFEHKVEKEMKVGSILIANTKRDESIIRNRRFKKLDYPNNIWMKVK
jgi:2-polyprenyl-3-methyl-5-hydroxy-6-metoxy-1,4-benzoquinol methylase